jgi:hypothetical protein
MISVCVLHNYLTNSLLVRLILASSLIACRINAIVAGLSFSKRSGSTLTGLSGNLEKLSTTFVVICSREKIVWWSELY